MLCDTYSDSQSRETGRVRYLMFAAASAALVFATKETSIISFSVLFLAHVCSRIYVCLRKKREREPRPRLPQPGDPATESRPNRQVLFKLGRRGLPVPQVRVPVLDRLAYELLLPVVRPA